MATTYTELLYHIVFSTKERAPVIDAEWRDRLHEYMGGIIRSLGGYSEEIGGTIDHVHLLSRLKPTHCIADVLCKLKKGSSEWVHNELDKREFWWQEGYGAFTVSPSHIGRVKTYIANQERHHQKRSFKEEYVWLLKKAVIDYDERYLW
ncbi:MAG TPA: IS200/IS605 family transposase [Acidobacteriota bacterium]